MNALDARRRLLGRNVYKKTVEGNPAIAQGSLSRRYPGITMQGWTEQAQYEGNQLFDKSEIVPTSQLQYIPVNVGDGEFTLSTQYNSLYQKDVFFLTGNVILGASSDTNGVDKNNPRTISSENGYVTVALRLNSERDMNPLDYDIMLNAGSTALPYEPYTGRAPSPNPDYLQEIVSAGKYNEGAGKYEYEVKLTGANLFNPSSDQKGYYAGTVGDAVSFNTNVGYSWLLEFTEFATGQYTISFDTDVNVRWRYYITDRKDVILALYEDSSANSTHNYRTFELPDGAKKFCFSILEIDSADEATIMLNVGDKELPCEPYRLPQTVTLTSDRPLTKWDKLEKRNGVWGWVYKSAEIVLDGSEDEVWRHQSDVSGKIQFYITLSDALYPYSEPFKEMFYCDTFLTTNNLGSIHNWQVRKGSFASKLTPVFKPSDDISAIGSWTSFLSENPMTILYATAEETFVPLSESEQEQMNALHTFRPTTVLSNDAGCNMELTYKTKKSLQSVPGGGV